MKTIVIAVLMLAGLLVVGIAAGQEVEETSAPMVFYGRGGLFLLYEGEAEAALWDECGDGYGWRVSPSGEWISRVEGFTDVRLCNLYTREVIDAPAPAEAVGEGPSVSVPSWSPDNKQIAWSLDYDSGDHFLIVYDLDSAESRVIVDDVPPSGAYPQVLWGRSGILVVSDWAEEENIRAPLYSPDGELLAEDLSNGQYFTSYFWADDEDGRELLVRVAAFMSVADAIDPAGGPGGLPERVVLTSLLAPDGLSIETQASSSDTLANLPGGDSLVINDLSSSLNDFTPFLPTSPSNVGIAPDGEAFVILDLDQLVWRDGEVTPLPENIPTGDGDGVLWGPMRYRIIGPLSDPRG